MTHNYIENEIKLRRSVMFRTTDDMGTAPMELRDQRSDFSILMTHLRCFHTMKSGIRDKTKCSFYMPVSEFILNSSTGAKYDP
jgi:hypothetical protein